MRIAVVPSRYPTPRTPAAGVFVREQVRALSARHDVAVVYPFAVGREELASGLWRHRVHDSADAGVPLIRPRVSLVPQIAHAEEAFLARWAAALDRGLDQLERTRWRPDVLHAHVSCPAGAAAVAVARRRGLPLVLTEHTLTARAATTPVRSRAIAAALAGVDAVVAVSPFLGADIERFAEEQGVALRRPVRAVGDVVDAARFFPGPGSPHEGLALLGVGNLLPVKGQRFAIEALPHLAELLPGSVTLTLVGSGPERPALEERAAVLGVGERVRFVGALHGDDLVAAYRSADIVVVPSLVETFSVVALEALACGVPVVATRCGGPEWFVDESCGALVDPGCPEALATGIASVARSLGSFDPARLHASAVGRFGVDAFNDALLTVYREVIGCRAGTPAVRERGAGS